MKTKLTNLTALLVAVITIETKPLIGQIIPNNMALIPGSSFQMGDTFGQSFDEFPLHNVYVSAFYIDKYKVTKTLWDEVCNWAIAHSYSFDHS